MVFKIFLILFSLYAMFRLRSQYVTHQTSWYWAVMWSAVWGVVILVALVPDITNSLASFVGVGRGADVFVYTAILVLLYTTHRLLVRQQKMSEEITELVRRIALDHPIQP